MSEHVIAGAGLGLKRSMLTELLSCHDDRVASNENSNENINENRNEG